MLCTLTAQELATVERELGVPPRVFAPLEVEGLPPHLSHTDLPPTHLIKHKGPRPLGLTSIKEQRPGHMLTHLRSWLPPVNPGAAPSCVTTGDIKFKVQVKAISFPRLYLGPPTPCTIQKVHSCKTQHRWEPSEDRVSQHTPWALGDST